jgi:diacylglycerol kinase family enzyme
VSVGVIWNRAARRARYLPVHRLFQEAEVVVTESPEEAESKARELARRHQTVVAVGGDGTINSVVNGLRGSEAALGLIPAGTGNVLARELFVPVHDPSDAARICMGEASTAIDLGECGDRLFVASAGFGVDAAVVARADGWKPVWGRMAFAMAASVEQFRRHRWRVVIDAEGKRVYEDEAVLVAAVNCPRYAGWRKPMPDTSLADGLLDLFVVTPSHLAGTPLADVAAWALLGLAHRSKRVRTFRAAEFQLRFEGPEPDCQLDGELVPNVAKSLRALPKVLQVKTHKAVI